MFLFHAYNNACVFSAELIMVNVSIMLVFLLLVAVLFSDFIPIAILTTLRALLVTFVHPINSMRLIRLRGFQLHYCCNFYRVQCTLVLWLMIFSQFTALSRYEKRESRHRVCATDFHVSKRFVINLCVSACRLD